MWTMRKTSVVRVQSMFHAIFKLEPFEHITDALLTIKAPPYFLEGYKRTCIFGVLMLQI